MSVVDHHPDSLPRNHRRKVEREYRWVFWAAFPFFLAVTIVSRLNPFQGRPAAPRPSVFREAWVAANSTLPFAFML
jgi:hypothetical protein